MAQGWFTDAPPGVLYGTIFFAYLPVMWVHIGTLKLWLSVPLLSSRAASERAIFFLLSTSSERNTDELRNDFSWSFYGTVIYLGISSYKGLPK